VRPSCCDRCRRICFAEGSVLAGCDARPEADELALVADPALERERLAAWELDEVATELLVLLQPSAMGLELRRGEARRIGAEEQLERGGVA
jgi:hypothetical protein